jgi:phospholipid/cholesterol/gamma-HCH transport system ATP-binding protein
VEVKTAVGLFSFESSHPDDEPDQKPFEPEPGASDTTPTDDFGLGNDGRNDGPHDASRVSIVNEHPPRPAPPRGAPEDEYRFHTYKVYPSGRPDAVEFVDVYKAFGRAHILRGLSMGLPEVDGVDDPRAVGNRKVRVHEAHRGPAAPRRRDVLVHRESVPNMSDERLFELRKRFGLLFQDGALFGSMSVYDNVAFPLRQPTEKGEDESSTT